MTPADRTIATSHRLSRPGIEMSTKANSGWRACLPLALLLGLGGCGGGGGGTPSATVPTYTTVGGNVFGLVGSGLVLRNDAGESLPVTAAGNFSFANRYSIGANYAVSVSSQPSNPSQTCEVFQGAGRVDSNSADTVAVDCVTITRGTFTGVDYGTSGEDGSYGVTPFDGAGHFTRTSIENTAGTVVSGVSNGGSYVNSFDGSIEGAITFNFNQGAVSADANAIISADLNPGEPAYVDIEVRQRQDPVTNADLQGSYEVVTYGNSGDTATLWTLVADGSGHYTGSKVQNNGGVITPRSAVAGTSGIAADGTVTVTPTSGTPLSGGLSVDGNTLVLSQLTSGQGPSITVGVRQGQNGFSTADASGVYAIAALGNSGGSGSLWYVTFDPKGNISGSTRSNDDEKIVSGSLAGTFSVAADGSLTVSFGGKPFTGGISADRQRLVLTNLNAGDAPEVWIGVRTGNYDPWGY
jgi:hypothetical protein